MAIEQWDHGDVAVICGRCDFELGRYHNSVDATNAAVNASWLVHRPTYDPPVELERLFESKPFYSDDGDDIEITDLEEYARLLRLWGFYEGIEDDTGMENFMWLGHLEGKLEEHLEQRMNDPVWAGDCWCHTCREDK
jgi:hypothetical protein